MNRPLLVMSALLLLATNQATASFIVSVDPASLSTNTIVDFRVLELGNRDDTFSVVGASFGERFEGQTVSYVNGPYDALDGLPTQSLRLVPGPSGENLILLFSPSTDETLLFGRGKTVGADGGASGEGAVSVLFSTDQSQIGFDAAIGSLGTNTTVQFFRRDGSLLGVQELTFETRDQSFAFRAENGDVAGISITNVDPGGLAYTNFRFDVAVVPEPSSLVLGAIGAIILLGYAWRRRKQHSCADQPVGGEKL